LHGEILHSAAAILSRRRCLSIAIQLHFCRSGPSLGATAQVHRNESNFSARGCLIDAFAIVWQNGMREAIVRGMHSDIFPATECPNQFSNR
jgi:hypothetical protein